MTRRIPIFSTIVVIAAALTMIGLGIWQLGRKTEKEALIAQYQAALQDDTVVPWPNPADYERDLFRRNMINEDSFITPTNMRDSSRPGKPANLYTLQSPPSDYTQEG